MAELIKGHQAARNLADSPDFRASHRVMRTPKTAFHPNTSRLSAQTSAKYQQLSQHEEA